jgi:hypothetical protein
MNMLRQTLHIFRKDLRALRWEVALVLLLCVALVATTAKAWSWPPTSNSFISPLLLLAWILVIARLIQNEPVPGDRQFWLTRPYQRPALLAAKLLFVAAVILAPLAASQVLILRLSGLSFAAGDLMRNLGVLMGVYLLPVAVVAALTRKLGHFFLVGVGIVVALVLSVYSIETIRWNSDRLSLWIAIAPIVAFTIGALLLQYWRRTTHIPAVMFGVALLPVLLSAHQLTQGSDSAAGAEEYFASLNTQIRIAARPPVMEVPSGRPSVEPKNIRIPVTIEGNIPSDVFIEKAGIGMETRTLAKVYDVTVVSEERRRFLDFTVDSDIYEQSKTEPVRLRIFASLLFGSESQTDVVRGGSPVRIPQLGECRLMDPSEAPGADFLVCRSGFGGLRLLVEAVGTNRLEVRRLLYASDPMSPFEVLLNPIHITRTYFRYPPFQASAMAPNMRLVVRDVLGSMNATTEIADFPLASYVVPEGDSR